MTMRRQFSPIYSDSDESWIVKFADGVEVGIVGCARAYATCLAVSARQNEPDLRTRDSAAMRVISVEESTASCSSPCTCSHVRCFRPATRTHELLEPHGKRCCDEHGKELDEMRNEFLAAISTAGRKGIFPR